MGLRRPLRKLFKKSSRPLPESFIKEKDLARVLRYPRFTAGSVTLMGKQFKFQDGASFVATYNELFVNEIYKFKPSACRTILDCGANMGLSALYFALNYPEHRIIAFEPDEHVYPILLENIQTYQMSNVTPLKKAVWIRNEPLNFYSDGGLGGRINNEYSNQEPRSIEAVPLADYLNEDVDFLKIDIEGAEDVLLKFYRAELAQVRNLFFEYHNDVNCEQTLHQLLQLVKEAGFHYYIKESGVRKRPFVDEELICETFDMAINVFCYRTGENGFKKDKLTTMK